eukprot:g19769.t1
MLHAHRSFASPIDTIPQSLRSLHARRRAVAELSATEDDWEIGRTKTLRPSNAGCFPDLINNEKIEHKVVCAVISGQMRHGIRLGQREPGASETEEQNNEIRHRPRLNQWVMRSSIYDIEELYGHRDSEEVCLGGSPTEVEFELQLKVQAPSPCGICRCSLAVLQPESANGPLEQSNDALLEVSFDASAEERKSRANVEKWIGEDRLTRGIG